MNSRERFIQLSQGQFAIIDEEDADRICALKWYCYRGYAIRNEKAVNGKRVRSYMHRVVLDAPQDMEVDHINGNKLDNRKQNLRLCTKSQNQQNKGKPRNNTSGYKGVRLHKCGRWEANIKLNDKLMYLGLYETADQAHKAYCAAADSLHGRFANYGAIRALIDAQRGEEKNNGDE